MKTYIMIWKYYIDEMSIVRIIKRINTYYYNKTSWDWYTNAFTTSICADDPPPFNRIKNTCLLVDD